MAVSLILHVKHIGLLKYIRRREIVDLTVKRSIMSTKLRLDKIVNDLKRNPFYDKYAEKIAKLQETSPEEFLARVSEKEKELQEEKVLFPSNLRNSVNSLWNLPMNFHKHNKFQRENLRLYTTSVSENKYVTTPIFYVNNVPHIGHLYTVALADSIARFNSMLGHRTILTTGTDEHGTKIEQAAELNKLPIKEYCDKISLSFKNLCDQFHINYSDFIRTTEPRHQKAVHHFWNELCERGHIYVGKYVGWYCVADEAFLSDMEVIDRMNEKKEIQKVSLESGHLVEWTEEENFKFRLSAFQDDLKHWLRDEKVIRPEKFYKILSRWVEDGSILQDISISRPVKRVSWGIRIPGDDSQSIYVWLDALINYLTVLGYPSESYRQFWPPSVQVIGKDILKFHGVYWPAFLIAAGLEPPKTLVCHSHWTVEGEKMSKSNKNVISPFDAATKYSPEGLRYFLLRESVPHKDSNFNEKNVRLILNAELANNMGNLVRRCTSDSVNKKKEIPDPKLFVNVLKSEPALKLKKNLESLMSIAEEGYKNYYIHHVIDAVMANLQSTNQMFDHHKPWALRKLTSDPVIETELKAVIALTLESVRVSALILYPVIPKLSSDLLDFLQVPQERRTWRDVTPAYLESPSSSSSLSSLSSPPDLQEKYLTKDCLFFGKIKI